jgi:Fic family protein
MPGRLVARVWHHDPTLYAPARYRRACRYEAFVPTPLSDLALHLDGELAGAVSEAEDAIRRLNDEAHPALRPLARLLLRTESIASSKVEGLQSGLRDLARAEARLASGGRAGPTAAEIVANIDAMEFAVREAARGGPFGAERILAIHARLMKATPNAPIAGRIRSGQNWIGGNDHNPCGADFVPPPPEEVLPLLEDLCAAIDDDLLPPVVQAALVHAQFETIHPFDDGNGRTGRALIHVVLRRRGIAPAYVPPISVVLANGRSRYIAGLTGFRGDGTAEWIGQFASASAASAHLAREYLEAVRALTVHWRARLAASPSAPRSDAAAWAVIEALPAHPLITAPAGAGAAGSSRPSTYQAIRELEVAGVLIPLSGARRNRSWEAEGLLELLEGLEAGRLPAVH